MNIKHCIMPKSENKGSNVLPAIAGGLTAGLTSIAWDFIFGAEKTTGEMLADAANCAGLGLLTTYSVARLANFKNCSKPVSVGLSMGLGVGVTASYRTVRSTNYASDEEMDMLPPLED